MVTLAAALAAPPPEHQMGHRVSRAAMPDLETLLLDLHAGLTALERGRYGRLTVTQAAVVHDLEASCTAALARLRDTPSAAAAEYGPLKLDRTRRAVTVQGQPVQLTRTEFDLLWRLVSQVGQTVTYEELARQVWGFPDAGSTIIKQHLSRLKAKIETVLGRPWPVRNVRSIGYLLE